VAILEIMAPHYELKLSNDSCLPALNVDAHGLNDFYNFSTKTSFNLTGSLFFTKGLFVAVFFPKKTFIISFLRNFCSNLRSYQNNTFDYLFLLLTPSILFTLEKATAKQSDQK
jgi:hypothetical protein